MEEEDYDSNEKATGKRKCDRKRYKTFYKKKKQIRCRSNETKISLIKEIPLLRSSDSDENNNGMIKRTMTLNTKKESINSPQSALIHDKDNPKSEYCLHATEDQSKQRKLNKKINNQSKDMNTKKR